MRVIAGALIWIISLFLLVIPLAILFFIKLVLIVIYCHLGKCTSNNNTSNSSTDDSNYELFSTTRFDSAVAVTSSWEKPVNHLGIYLKVRGVIDVGQFREHFVKCFSLGSITTDNNDSLIVVRGENSYDKFFSFLVTRGGHAFRALSKTVNLTEHIVERKLEETRQNKSSSSNSNDVDPTSLYTLEEFISQWILEDYIENKPAWQVGLIHVSTCDAETSPYTAILLKMHHGFCDGYSLLHIVDKLTGGNSPYIVKDFQDGFGVQLKQMLEAPFNLGKQGGAPPEKNPFRVHVPPPPPEGKYEWMYSFTSFSLEDMKFLRKKNGNVHMVAVIWTVLTGAMRRFLEEENAAEIPENVVVCITLPWPRHPAMISGSENKDKICNHWASGVFHLPLRDPDPLTRLQKIEHEFVSHQSLGVDKTMVRIMSPVLWTMPGSLLTAALTKDLGMSSAFTGLIGADSYSLLGYSVEKIHPLLVLHHHSCYVPLSCFTFSHSGKMEVTIGANPRSILKNKQTLDKLCHKFCHDELQDFLTITNNRGKLEQ